MFIYFIPIVGFVVLAALYELNWFKVNKFLYGPALFAISLFGGLRFETGADWPGYTQFFDLVDPTDNPFVFYFGSGINLTFEFGYYLLNWTVKALGGQYWIIQLLASLFCGYAVFRFTRRFPGNRFYVIALYVGYSFLLLQFAQVRQSIAIGFFLIGLNRYFDKGSRWQALGLGAIGLLFQYSAIIYLIMSALIMWWPTQLKYRVAIIVGLSIACIIPLVVDPYGVVGLFAAGASAEKLAIYQDTRTVQGAGQIAYGVYLLCIVAYIVRYGERFDTPVTRFIMRYSVISLLLKVLLIVVFPGSYVMYSRGYVIACLFQGVAASLIFRVCRGWLHRTVFAASLLISCAYFARILMLYSSEFVPYRSIIGSPR